MTKFIFKFTMFNVCIVLAMQVIGAFIVIYFGCLIAFSGLLVSGLYRMNRGLMLPWMITFGIAIAFQLVFGLWLLGGYYIYVSVFFVSANLFVLLFVLVTSKCIIFSLNPFFIRL